MPYKIAGIDVHKRMLAVVVSDVESNRARQGRKNDFADAERLVNLTPAKK
jgi:hypothetical protein